MIFSRQVAHSLVLFNPSSKSSFSLAFKVLTSTVQFLKALAITKGGLLF